jgi:hypothetical protein
MMIVMENSLHRSVLLAGLFCLLLAGCIKDPGPCIPLPPKPSLLLTEVRTIFIVEGSEPGYGKVLDIYRYNKFHKPWLHIRMASGTDTTQLIQTNVDTLYYDNLQRVVKVVGYQVDHWTRVRLRQFYYNGNERLPARAEYQEDGGNWAYIPPSARYIWGDTVVLQITGADTSRAVYSPQGNFYGWNGFRDNRYDNLPNAERFFNLEHGLALNAPDNYSAVLLPRYSANNWTENGTSDFRIQRFTTPNATGQVGLITWRDQLRGDFLAESYYTYMSVQ